MKRFYKLGLLFGFVSVVGIQGYMVEAATFMDEARSRDTEDISQVSSMMRHYFQDDESESPLVGNNDDSSRLVDAVAGYMKAADGKSLHGLFYQPDVGAWQNLYWQATGGKAFSILDLIDLLDTTKTRIFDVYRAQHRPDTEAYFYISTLFDNVMQEIFAGCWGISDEPVEDHVVRNLKEVYGRVVSGILKFASDGSPDNRSRNLFESLEVKKSGSSPTAQAHLAALQECVAAVMYSALELIIPAEHKHEFTVDGLLNTLKENNIELSQPSVERTLGHVSYQNPLMGIIYDVDNFNRIALSLASLKYAFGGEFDQYDDERAPLERNFSDLTRELHEEGADEAEIGREAFDIVSKLDPETQTDEVLQFISMIAHNLQSWGHFDSGKILSLTPADQDALLDLHAQALEASANPNERLRHWKSLVIKIQNRRTVFDLEKVFLRIAAACETVTDTQDESYPDFATDLISRELCFYEYFLDLSAAGQRQLVESLSLALGRNKFVQETSDEYKVWMDLCEPVCDYTTGQKKTVLPEARPALIEKTIRSLERIDTKKAEELADFRIPQFYDTLSVGEERQCLMDALRDGQLFKAFPADQREALIATFSRIDSRDAAFASSFLSRVEQND